MRSLFLALLAASIVALCACGSSSKDEQERPPAAAIQQSAAELQKKREAACGSPVRFPVSDKCLKLAGDQAAFLTKENDLMIAVWRNCSLTPASAEAIRRETIARGGANTEIGRRIIGEMERTEQDSDSPCVRADMSDPDCVAGDMNACAQARSKDRACLTWFQDPDTQKRIQCLGQTAQNPVCTQAVSAEANSDGGYFSDAQQLADDCRRAQNSCLHTFDECADAKDALDKFLAQRKGGGKPAASGQQPQTASQPQTPQP